MTDSRMKVAIAGFGLEGRAVYDYLKESADIEIYDELAVNLAGVDAVFHQTLTIPGSVEVVYKSPGIPTHKLVLESSNTRISTLTDLVLEKVRDRTIGVTGTKGKSTTASLIHHILKGAGRDSVLLGNIGMNGMHLLENDSLERVYVAELSSYQCEHITHSPHISVFTNFYPEHLSHHGSLEQYREAKLNIARFQTKNDVFINGSEIETTYTGKVVQPDFSLQFETKLQGEHNQRNCALAYAAVEAVGVSDEEARAHIASFEPLPYRLESLGEHKGITFYDDSLATIPEATLASLQALGKVDTLILGGEDRGISFESFAKKLSETEVGTFIIFPDTGSKMVTEVKDRTVIPVSNMEAAVRAAYEHTPVGGVVLLSNASPSFNLFADYKDKSAQYRELVET